MFYGVLSVCSLWKDSFCKTENRLPNLLALIIDHDGEEKSFGDDQFVEIVN